MPTIHAAAGWRIMMYFRDHGPPHFHVVTRDRREAQVRIADLAVMAGSVRANVLEAALRWAAANRNVLSAKWQELHPE
jgi:hypothetical protein